jgi:thiopurine S-methyltransferase
MKPEFWLERWHDEKIGFHQNEYNSRLVQHWDSSGAEPQRTCVPLCGKSLDLRFLAQFGAVTGVELAQSAIRDFFREWACPAEQSEVFGVPAMQGNGVTILHGDIFELPIELHGNFSHVYDRASMIALPPAMRSRYVKVLHDLLEPGGQVLLVTIQYPDGELPGPPFSVGPDWLSAHAGECFSIELIETIDTWRADSRLAEEGLSAVDTHVFRLKKREM